MESSGIDFSFTWHSLTTQHMRETNPPSSGTGNRSSGRLAEHSYRCLRLWLHFHYASSVASKGCQELWGTSACQLIRSCFLLQQCLDRSVNIHTTPLPEHA